MVLYQLGDSLEADDSTLMHTPRTRPLSHAHVPKAATAADVALKLQPAATPALVNSAFFHENLCQWRQRRTLTHRLARAVRTWPERSETPFPTQGVSLVFTHTQDAMLLQRAAVAARPIAPQCKGVHWSRELRPARLRVGFVSSDFRVHSVGQAIAGVLEGLARERFEVYGYNLRLRHDAVAQRCRRAMDHERDVASLDPQVCVEAHTDATVLHMLGMTLRGCTQCGNSLMCALCASCACRRLRALCGATGCRSCSTSTATPRAASPRREPTTRHRLHAVACPNEH